MINVALILIGLSLFATGIINYISTHHIVKTRTEIIRVHLDKNNAIEKVFRNGEWDESLEWLSK